MRNNTIDDNFWDDQEPSKKEYFWQSFEDQQVFCGFDIIKSDDGLRENDKKHPKGMDRVTGISSDASIDRLGTYKAAKELGYPYVGISLFKPVMLGDLYLVCIDLDWKRSPDGVAAQEQFDLMFKLDELGCCYEVSYSGKGAHYWVLCKKEHIPRSQKLDKNCEIEVFCSRPGQGVNVLITDEDAVGELKEVNLLEVFPIPKTLPKPTLVSTAPAKDYQVDLAADMELAPVLLSYIPQDNAYKEEWLAAGMILKEHFGDAGFKIWDDWSKKGAKYDAEVMVKKWDSFTRDGLKFASLVAKAKEYGYRHEHKKSTPLEDFGEVNLETGEIEFPEAKEKPKKSLLDAAYISPTTGLQAPQWVVDGIIPNGVGVIAGVGGVGKTTALMPIVATVAGFDDHLSDITVKINRHVLYITEDPVQAQKAIYAIKRWRKSEKDISKIEDYVHLYNSNQYKISDLKALLIEAVDRYSMEYRGIMFPPLVVFDTASANIAVDNENDNAEIARYMTMFKQLWAKHMMPIWLVNHLAKSANGLSVDELDAHSARGASAWRDNSNWTANLAIDSNSKDRILQIMKVREELDFNEIVFSSIVHTEPVLDIFGDMVDVHYRYCTATKSSKNARAYERLTEMDNAIMKAVKEIMYPSKNDVCEAVTGSKKTILGRITYLIETGKLKLEVLPKDLKGPGKVNYLSGSP